jgi:nitrogen fixation protein FixH
MKTEGWFANGIEGRHGFMGLLVFFGVMLVANGVLVYFAVGTFSGGDKANPYQSGLHYNDTIAADERQTTLGWQTELAYDNESGRVSLQLLDKTDGPVGGLKLGGTISRPATDREDRAVEFEEISQGVYVADARLAPGVWVISVASVEAVGDDPIYRLKRRLSVADRQ